MAGGGGIESIILLLVLLGLIFAGVHVALAMAFAGLFGILAFAGPHMLSEAARAAWWMLYNWLLVSAFLFILIAELMSKAGVADLLFDGLSKFASGIRGALAMAVIWGCLMMGVTTGSGIAEVATVGRVSIPAMLKRGYAKTLALGSATASGALGYLIPPSLFLIIYGAWAGVSVAKLFAAALFPGLLMAGLLTATTVIITTLKPELAPKVPALPLRQRAVGLFSTWPVLLLGLTILGTIFTGIATPTEAAGIGVLLALVIILSRPSSRHQVNWLYLKESTLNSTRLTSSLMFIIVGASILSYAWDYLGTPMMVARWAVSLEISPMLTLVILYIGILLFGCCMEGLSMMLLILPIVLPVIVTLGFDATWFGVMMGMLIACADITPPVGMHLYTTKTMFPEHKFQDIIRGTFPYFIAELVCIAVLTAFPMIALWLPKAISN